MFIIEVVSKIMVFEGFSSLRIILEKRNFGMYYLRSLCEKQSGGVIANRHILHRRLLL